MRAIGVLVVAALAGASALPSWSAQQDMPRRKPGLWQQSITTPGPGGTTTMTACTDAATDDLLARQGGASARCDRQSVRREGDRVVVEAVCRDAGTTVRTRGVFTGDFDSRYRGELHATFDPPLQGMRESRQTLEARWLGPCPPGRKPGDVQVQGMPAVDVERMRGMDPAQLQEMMRKYQQMAPGGGAR